MAVGGFSNVTTLNRNSRSHSRCSRSLCSWPGGAGQLRRMTSRLPLRGTTRLLPQLIQMSLLPNSNELQPCAKQQKRTVAIFGLDGGGGGSGVLITRDGYALTNYHVSSACGDHMRCGLNDGKVYDAVIVGVDATGDVSLIKLLGT